jgi:TonB family protein
MRGILNTLTTAMVALGVAAGVADAQMSDVAFSAKDVDKPAVQLENGVAPQFPDSMLALGIGGWAKVTFVVDTNGRVDMASFRPMEAAGSQLFTEAVREALPRMRFLPAELGGRPVRQSIERKFDFVSPIRRVCNSPCPFMLLPMITQHDQPVPNSNPLPELRRQMQSKLPFVVEQLSAADMPLGAATFLEYQVDKRAAPAPGNVAPAYPDSLEGAKISGEVVAKFVVDTTGRVKMESVEILSATHQLFAIAVVDALPMMKFSPAELNRTKVSQVVQQSFIFHTKP